MAKTQKNEGEGNRSAARRYNKETRDFVESGKVEKSAEEAGRAATGDERRAMKEAEKEGLKKARH